MSNIADVDVEKVTRYASDHLPPPGEWSRPDGYPHLVALCVMDSIWSINAHYERHVIPVLKRYRAYQTSRGGDADHDSATDLLASIDAAGGPGCSRATS